MGRFGLPIDISRHFELLGMFRPRRHPTRFLFDLFSGDNRRDCRRLGRNLFTTDLSWCNRLGPDARTQSLDSAELYLRHTS